MTELELLQQIAHDINVIKWFITLVGGFAFGWNIARNNK